MRFFSRNQEVETQASQRDDSNISPVANIPPQLLLPFQAPIPQMPQDDNFYRYRIQSMDIIDQLEHQLKGEIFDEVKGVWISGYGRWINDIGIAKILGIIYACGINKNTFLGYLRKDQIDFKCCLLKKMIAEFLFNKYKLYQVDKAQRGLLVAMVVNTIHSALSRCEEGREAEQLSTATQRHEIYSEQLNPRSGSGQPLLKRLLPSFLGGR